MQVLLLSLIQIANYLAICDLTYKLIADPRLFGHSAQSRHTCLQSLISQLSIYGPGMEIYTASATATCVTRICLLPLCTCGLEVYIIAMRLRRKHDVDVP